MVATATYITDSVLALRAIVDNVTDPVSASRPSDSKFVVSAWPLRTTFYPVISIRSEGTEDIHSSGFKSELMWVRLSFAIRIWARNEVEKEKLTQSVVNELRTAQFDGGSALSDDEGLHDLKFDTEIEKELLAIKNLGANYVDIDTTYDD